MKLNSLVLAAVFLALILTPVFAKVVDVPSDSGVAFTKVNSSPNLSNKKVISTIGPVQSPGTIVGYTWYEHQHNYTMARQVAIGDSGNYFTWTDLVDPEPANRYVDYNFYDGTAWLGASHVTPAAGSGGFTGIDLLSDGRAVLIYHLRFIIYPEEKIRATCLSIEQSPGTGSFNLFDLPDSIPGAVEYGGWPKAAVDSAGYIHVVFGEASTDSTVGPFPLGYIRCEELNSDTLICQGPRAIGPYVIEANTKTPSSFMATYLDSTGMWWGGYVLCTSPVSNKVSIVYLKNRKKAYFRIDHDVLFIESLYGGQDWIDGDFPSPVNITNYSDGDLERAWGDLAALYDYNDKLHILFNTAYRNETMDTYNSNDIKLYHWSQASGKRVVTSAHWDIRVYAFGANISKMSLGEDPNDSCLYAVWTQFNSGDTSAAGFSNGEIYAAVSTNDGLTWDPGRNLTNSPSVGCLPGNCESDNWSSIAELINDTLHILYVNDRDAGFALRYQGAWTENPILYLAHPAFEPILAPSINVTLSQDILTQPQAYLDTFILVENFGNSQLDVSSIFSDSNWIQIIGPANFSIPEAGSPETVQVRFDATSFSEERFLKGDIIILNNDYNPSEQELHLPIDFWVVNEFAAVRSDTLATAKLYHVASNTGTIGGITQRDFTYIDESLDYLYNGSFYIARTEEGDTLVYRDLFHIQRLLRPLDSLNVGSTSKCQHAWTRFTDKDGIGKIGVKLDVYAPSHPDSSDFVIYRYEIQNRTGATIEDLYVGMVNDWDLPDVDGTNWLNYAGFNDSLNLMWVQASGVESFRYAGMTFLSDDPLYGATAVDHQVYVWPYEDYPTSYFYQFASSPGFNVETTLLTDFNITMSAAKIDLSPSDTLVVAFALVGINEPGATLSDFENNVRKARAWYYLLEDSLIFSGYSPIDLIVKDPLGDSIGMGFNSISGASYDTFDINGDGDPDDRVFIAKPLAGTYEVRVKAEPDASPEDHYTLSVRVGSNAETILDSNATVPQVGEEISYDYTVMKRLRGDANGDGETTISDVVYLVNYLFRNGDAPVPIECGDVNCDTEVNIVDAVYLVNYLFRDGPSPCS